MVVKFVSVAEYLDAQTDARRAEVQRLRDLVTDAAPQATEILKWNSPSYVVDGVDRLTVTTAGAGPARLILHRGVAEAEDKNAATEFTGDPTGLLTWHSNIRASLVVPSPEQREAAAEVIRAWLAS
jgi:hypothetical protein